MQWFSYCAPEYSSSSLASAVIIFADNRAEANKKYQQLVDGGKVCDVRGVECFKTEEGAFTPETVFTAESYYLPYIGELK